MTPWNIVSLICTLLGIGTILSLIDIFIRKITEHWVDEYINEKYELGFYNQTEENEELEKRNKKNKKLHNLNKYCDLLPCRLWKSGDKYKGQLFIGNTTTNSNEIIEGYFILDDIPYNEILRYVIKCRLKEKVNFCDYPFLRLAEYYDDEEFEEGKIKTVKSGTKSTHYFNTICFNKKYNLKNCPLYPTTYMLYQIYLSELDEKLRKRLEYSNIINQVILPQ